MTQILSYRKLIQPEDINPGGRLFGGKLMAWADEAAGIYAMCQMNTKSIVTLKVSEVLFKNPAVCGDVLEFWLSNKKVGITSLTVECVVKKKAFTPFNNGTVMECEFVFVAIDALGKPVPHHLTPPTL